MFLLALFACEPPPLPVADTTPSIRITWPPSESELTGCETVAVEVENWALVEFPREIGKEEGIGHYHIYHPAGYNACYKPYCFVDFSSVASTTEPYLTAVLAYTDHSEVLDADGDRYEHQIPINFIPGDCASGGDTGGGY